MTDPQTGEPLDNLAPDALAQIAQLGSKSTTVSEIVQQKDKIVYGAIQSGLDIANEHVYDSKVREIIIMHGCELVSTNQRNTS